MNLRLINFQRYEDMSFKFLPGTTKISGSSGIGKTTIFKAIDWCLYGKVTKVGTMKDGKVVSGGTKVIMSTVIGDKDIQIEREGQKRVTLFIGGDTYEDAIAQTRIDTIFGTYEMFHLASYLKAETMHRMISSTPSDKRAMTSILFPDANKHAAYKAKVSGKRKEIHTVITDTRMKVSRLEGATSTMEEQYPWVKDPLPEAPEGDVDTMTKELKGLQVSLTAAEKAHSAYTVLKEQLEAIPPIEDDTQWKSEMDAIQGQLLQATVDTKSRDAKIGYLQTQIDAIDTSAYPEQGECTRILGILADRPEPVPDGAISTLTTEIETKKELLSEYEEAMKAINHNKKVDTIYRCPSCSAKLKMTDTLVEATDTIDPMPVKHVITSRDIQILNRKISTLEARMDTLQAKHDRYVTFYNRHSSIIHMDKEVVQGYLDTHRRKDTLLKDLATLQADTRTYMTRHEHNSLSKREKELSSLISKNRSHKEQKARIQDMIASYTDTGTRVRDLTDRVSTLKDKIDTISEYQRKDTIVTKYRKYTDALTKYRDTITTYQDKVSKCDRLSTILDQVYQAYVGTKLDEIAYDISELGKIFFDETMNISLTPGKESSTGMIRPSFDMTVEYGGIQYDDTRSMSTGEKKRLSLILMMVLTKYTDGKMILLDEALTSIGMEQRGIVMNEVSKLGIPILLTSHDEIPGGYHHSLNLG